MTVQISYAEQVIPSNHIIDVGIFPSAPKTIEIACYNDTKKDMERIRIVSNLPEKAYQFRHPERIERGRRAKFYLTFDADALWDDDVLDIAFKIEYDLVKIIGN